MLSKLNSFYPFFDLPPMFCRVSDTYRGFSIDEDRGGTAFNVIRVGAVTLAWVPYPTGRHTSDEYGIAAG